MSKYNNQILEIVNKYSSKLRNQNLTIKIHDKISNTDYTIVDNCNTQTHQYDIVLTKYYTTEYDMTSNVYIVSSAQEIDQVIDYISSNLDVFMSTDHESMFTDCVKSLEEVKEFENKNSHHKYN